MCVCVLSLDARFLVWRWRLICGWNNYIPWRYFFTSSEPTCVVMCCGWCWHAWGWCLLKHSSADWQWRSLFNTCWPKHAMCCDDMWCDVMWCDVMWYDMTWWIVMHGGDDTILIIMGHMVPSWRQSRLLMIFILCHSYTEPWHNLYFRSSTLPPWSLSCKRWLVTSVDVLSHMLVCVWLSSRETSSWARSKSWPPRYAHTLISAQCYLNVAVT